MKTSTIVIGAAAAAAILIYLNRARLKGAMAGFAAGWSVSP